MRHTWPDRELFKIDGKESGRCYLTIATAGRHVWLWTVYGSTTGG